MGGEAQNLVALHNSEMRNSELRVLDCLSGHIALYLPLCALRLVAIGVK